MPDPEAVYLDPIIPWLYIGSIPGVRRDVFEGDRCLSSGLAACLVASLHDGVRFIAVLNALEVVAALRHTHRTTVESKAMICRHSIVLL